MDDQRKLQRILAIELQDLIEDIHVLSEHIRRQLEDGKTTNYVATANLGLLTTETDAVRELIRWLDGVTPTEFEGVTAFREAIVEEFRRITKRHHFPESIFALVKRKVEKLTHYIWDQTVG